MNEIGFRGKGNIDFCPEMPDVCLHGIGKDIRIVIPNMRDNLFFGQCLAGMAHEVLKEYEFLSGQLDTDSIP